MECKNCKYYSTRDNPIFPSSVCKIAHIVNPKKCNYISSDEEVSGMDICYNCKHWIGGGDWGLSCMKNYYDTNSNGFEKACDMFDKRLED